MVGFIFGGNTGETAESVARKRALLEGLQAQIMGAAPKNAQEGWGALLKGIGAGIGKFQLDRQEKAGADKMRTTFEDVAKGFFGRNAASAIPASAVSGEVSATSPSPTATTGGLLGDFMAPIRETVKNPYALAAIASTGNAESGFDPAKANARWADPSQSGQPGTAGGLMSWRNDRLKALEAFAQGNGEDPSNISAATQAKFFLQEDPNLITALNGAKSLEEAQGLMDNAWKYAGYDQPSKERANRLASARSYLSAFQPTETASLDPAAGMPAAGQSNTDWLRYSNKDAIRSQPINDKLSNALSFLPDMGVTMEVFSGGQPSADEGGRRTGSPRHNHGGAADVFFYKDGRKLDWSNPDDQPIFAEIVRRGKANGITGFGAGDGYMQPGSMHIGFGNPAVWGAGGKGENAADWLRTAYYAPADGNSAVSAINAQMQPQAAPPLPDPVNVAAAPRVAGPDVQGLESPFVPADMRRNAPVFGGTAQGEPMERMRAARGNPNSPFIPKDMRQAQPAAQPAASSAVQLAQAGGIDPRLYQIIASPFTPSDVKAAAQGLLEQQMLEIKSQRDEQVYRARKAWERQEQQSDPKYQAELRKLEREAGKEQSLINAGEGRLYDPNTKTWISPPSAASGGKFRFSGNSVEAQALNGLMDAGQLTEDQAQQLAAGKQITNPADGSIIFMTPQGIFNKPAPGAPAQPATPEIDIFAGSPAGGAPSTGAPSPAQPAPAASPPQMAGATPPGAIQLTPGKAQMPTEATRNRAANVDQAFNTITGELDRYAQLVKDHGIELAPGEARDNMNSVRQGIMLQLKELFNLGVLNGPDLGLMERMIYDPVIDVTKEGGILNLPSQLWDATTNGAEGRANNSVTELKRMLGNIKQSVDGSLAGQRSGGQPAPDGWNDVGGGVKIRKKP